MQRKAFDSAEERYAFFNILFAIMKENDGD